MKTFIAVVLLAALASAEFKTKFHEDLAQYRDECVKKLDVPADLVEKYKLWQYPNDAVTHCFVMCVLEKFEIFDQDTGLNVENIHHLFAEGSQVDHGDEAHAKIEKCADINTQGSSVCEWAYRGGMCLLSSIFPLCQQSILPEYAQHVHYHDHREHLH